jgi:hypothetical protein
MTWQKITFIPYDCGVEVDADRERCIGYRDLTTGRGTTTPSCPVAWVLLFENDLILAAEVQAI